MSSINNEGGHAVDPFLAGLIPAIIKFTEIFACLQRRFQSGGIQSAGSRNGQDRLDLAYVLFFYKMGPKQSVMKAVHNRGGCGFSRKQKGGEGHSRIIQSFGASEGQVGNTGLTGQFTVKLLEDCSRKHICKQPSIRWRFRVYFKRPPFDSKGNLLSNDIDNRLADITERSDIVEIKTYFHYHDDVLENRG